MKASLFKKYNQPLNALAINDLCFLLDFGVFGVLWQWGSGGWGNLRHSSSVSNRV